MIKSKSKNCISISLILLSILVLFLPISSWLVSLTGLVAISALRDLLVLLLLVCSLLFLDREELRRSDLTLALALIVWGAASVFWREASLVQWLKGFRFIYGPIALYLASSLIPFSTAQKRTIIKVASAIALFIGLIAILDFFGVHIPLATKLSGVGALESSHYVGTLMVKRVQAVLAGPNALGLYLLAIFAALCAWKKRTLWLNLAAIITAALIILTFSRSCFIALAVICLLLVWNKLSSKIGRLKSGLITAISVLVISGGILWAYKAGVGEQYLTHNSSSSLRYEQYQRIWNQKLEIGLTGRGLGTAGPSSQNRADGGENHWTENTFLDFFEELGLVGLILFAAWLIVLLQKSYRHRDDFWGKAAFYALVSFIIAGVFLNFYTGQAGIWMVMLFAGLGLKQETESKKLQGIR